METGHARERQELWFGDIDKRGTGAEQALGKRSLDFSWLGKHMERACFLCSRADVSEPSQAGSLRKGSPEPHLVALICPKSFTLGYAHTM